MEDYSHVQQPNLRYQYQFGMDQLDQMSDCFEAHGFAIVKNILPKQIIENLNQSVIDAADPNRALNQGDSRTLRAWVESDPGAWQLQSLYGGQPTCDRYRSHNNTSVSSHHSHAEIQSGCLAYRLARILFEEETT